MTTYAVGDTALGRLLVASTDRGLRAVLIGDDDAGLTGDLRRRLPRDGLREGEAGWHAVADLIDAPTDADLPLDVVGTPFQQQVWSALQRIPVGQTRTYAEVAAGIGRPTATRAVAAACGANPVAIVVPCHRVIGSNGKLTGYRWGVERKRKLLELEHHLKLRRSR